MCNRGPSGAAMLHRSGVRGLSRADPSRADPTRERRPLKCRLARPTTRSPDRYWAGAPPAFSDHQVTRPLLDWCAARPAGAPSKPLLVLLVLERRQVPGRAIDNTAGGRRLVAVAPCLRVSGGIRRGYSREGRRQRVGNSSGPGR